jgi:uncharacterized membrane protein YgdD (TMEM256/DUF423 family)
MPRLFLICGSVSAFIAVVLGAFAAHLLKDRLAPDLFQVFEVGVRYQMYHALALLAQAAAMAHFPEVSFTPVGWLFTAGTILFSGSLYLMSFTGIRWLGVITPAGGLCFLAGWLWLGWSVWKSA